MLDGGVSCWRVLLHIPLVGAGNRGTLRILSFLFGSVVFSFPSLPERPDGGGGQTKLKPLGAEPPSPEPQSPRSLGSRLPLPGNGASQS